MENSKKGLCSCSKHHPLKKSLVKSGKKASFINVMSGVLLFIFPKCPLCWAAYGSIFSFIGVEQMSYNANWRYIILVAFLIGSFLLIRKHYINKSWFSILLYGLGMLLLLTTDYLNFNETWLLLPVLFLIILSNFSITNHYKLKSH